MTQTLEQIYTAYPALRKYPEEVARQMYQQMNPIRTLSDIQKGDWVSDADVLVIRVLGTSAYVGCPNCFTKKEGVEAGISYDCKSTKCGNTQRIAIVLNKWTLLGSDETTKVILDFPPFGYKLQDGETLVAKVVSIRGRVQDPRENKDKTGKVTGTTPVIMVKELKILSDIRDAGAGSLEATARPAPTSPSTPTPTPAINATVPRTPTNTILSPEKLNGFNLWMTFRTENGSKPVAETQLKTYIENNLHLTLPDFLPYLDAVRDSAGGNLYKLKAKTA